MRLAKSLVAIGEMRAHVDDDLAGREPLGDAAGPNSTSSTSGVSGTMVTMTSDVARDVTAVLAGDGARSR